MISVLLLSVLATNVYTEPAVWFDRLGRWGTEWFDHPPGTHWQAPVQLGEDAFPFTLRGRCACGDCLSVQRIDTGHGVLSCVTPAYLELLPPPGLRAIGLWVVPVRGCDWPGHCIDPAVSMNVTLWTELGSRIEHTGTGFVGFILPPADAVQRIEIRVVHDSRTWGWVYEGLMRATLGRPLE